MGERAVAGVFHDAPLGFSFSIDDPENEGSGSPSSQGFARVGRCKCDGHVSCLRILGFEGWPLVYIRSANCNLGCDRRGTQGCPLESLPSARSSCVHLVAALLGSVDVGGGPTCKWGVLFKGPLQHFPLTLFPSRLEALQRL